MIGYTRTEWFGWGYFIQCKGSVLPKCIPYVGIACFVAWAVSSGNADQWFKDNLGWEDKVEDYFGHPFSMQLFGLIYGYLSITRMNITYQRYVRREGSSCDAACPPHTAVLHTPPCARSTSTHPSCTVEWCQPHEAHVLVLVHSLQNRDSARPSHRRL